MDKKGMSVWALPGIIVLLVVIAIIMGVGQDINTDLRDDFVDGSPGCNSSTVDGCNYAYNSTEGGLNAVKEVADWQDNIGKIVGVVVILGLIMGTLGYMAMRR